MEKIKCDIKYNISQNIIDHNGNDCQTEMRAYACKMKIESMDA